MVLHQDHSNSTIGSHRRSVGVFSNRQAAEQALRDLRDSGFPMDRVSVITRDTNHQGDIAGANVHDTTKAQRSGNKVNDKVDDSTGNKADEGGTIGAVTGGTLGGLTGLLVGLGTLAIPGIGPVMLAGATATAIATTLAGGAIGAVTGGLLGGLIGLGIPEERARVYQDRVARGEYLVIVDGNNTEISQAERILHHHKVEEYGVYDAPISGSAREATASRDFKRAIGLFAHRRDTEAALTEIRGSGFGMDRVSVIAKDSGHSEQIAGTNVDANIERRTGNKADEGVKAGATTGAAVGGLGGLLVGLGTLAIPGIGPVILGGAAATALATALGGGAIGAAAGGLVGGLVGLGIPEDRAKVYRDRLNQGDDLVIIEGAETDIRRIEPILARHDIREWEMYDAEDVKSSDGDNTIDSIYQDRARDERTNPVPPTGRVKPDVTVVDRRHENRGDR